ncbi:hypothetical protein FACS1894184_06660 [Clostridia bacterium]|nr:hypothetical protein FACS1894184_06660 [Clostridia bacterium]
MQSLLSDIPNPSDDELLLSLMRFSDYKYERSGFFAKRPDTVMVLEHMFLVVMHNLMPLLISHKITLNELAYQYNVYSYSSQFFLDHASGEAGSIQLNPDHDTRIFIGYIIKTLEVKIRIAKRHNIKITSSLETAKRDIRGFHYQPEPLYKALDDDAFSPLLDEAIELYIAHSRNLELTCPLDDPCLLTARAKDLDMINNQEPNATLRKFHSVHVSPYNSFHYEEQYYRQALVIAQSLYTGSDTEPLDEQFKNKLPQLSERSGYENMRDDQLVQYIAWRSSYIAGGQPPSSAEAVLLHALELIHGVGVNNIHDAMDGLARLLTTYTKPNSRINNRLTSWMRDLYVFNYIKPAKPPIARGAQRIPSAEQQDPPNGLSRPFISYVTKYKLTKYYPNLLVGASDKLLPPGQRFELYASISFYKILNSRMFVNPYIPMLVLCFCAALDAVQAALANADLYDVTLEKLMVSKRQGQLWKPFEQAVLYPPKVIQVRGDLVPQRTRLTIDNTRKDGAGEQFVRGKNGWSCKGLVVMSSAAPAIAGSLMRATESYVREQTKFPGKFSRDRFLSDFVTQGLIKDGWDRRIYLGIEEIPFDKAIERAVCDTLRSMYPNGFTAPSAKPVNRTKAEAVEPETHVSVSVDFTSLDKVRNDADWVFGRLTADTIGDDEDTVDTDDSIDIYDNDVDVDVTIDEPSRKDGDSTLDPWQSFVAALTDAERSLVSAVLTDPSPNQSLRKLAQLQGVMPAAFIERINSKALDYIGDSLIEDSSGIRVIEDYREELTAMLSTYGRLNPIMEVSNA